MGRYKAVFTAIVIVAGAICLVIIGMPYAVHIKPRLSPQEQQLAGYQYQKVEMSERKAGAFSGLTNPMTNRSGLTAPSGEAGRDGYPKENLAELAPQGKDQQLAVEKPPAVSLISIKDRSRMAIVNGEVVKEGDRTKHGKIIRITRSGVLMKTQEGQRWMNIE